MESKLGKKISLDEDSIDISELIGTFRENMQRTKEYKPDKSETFESISHSTKSRENKQLFKTHARTMNDHFEKKLMLDLIKNSQGKKKKTFHGRMLARGFDSGLNGKMIVYEDYHAYNSDDSSDISDEGNSLFYRYGMGSRYMDDSIKSDLIYRSSKTEGFLGQKKNGAKMNIKNKSKKNRRKCLTG